MEPSCLKISTVILPVSISTSSEPKSTDHSQTNIVSTSHSFTNDTSPDHARSCHTENFIVVWVDPIINQSDDDTQHSIIELLRIVNSIEKFIDPELSVDFIRNVKDKNMFLILPDDLVQQVVPLIQDLTQLNSVYVFSDHKSQHRQYAKEFKKMQGVFTQVEPICHALRQDIRHSAETVVPISVITTPFALDMNELDQSFIYSQLLKEIFLEIPHDDMARKEFVDFCRTSNITNENELQKLNEFEQEYHKQSAIWWYTSYCLLYSMLNQALRTQDNNTILKMGFFLRDLHHQIQQIHSKANAHHPLTVFREQGMCHAEFEKLSKSKGGLLSFNNFLSTSKDYIVSYNYADSARQNPDLVGIMFQIEIDPSISSTPFASITDISYFNESENEVLFSMTTVFRISEMEEVSDRLWFVNLTLKGDKDLQLTLLTEYIRQESNGPTGLHRLGQLMIRMGEFNKAEEIFRALIDKSEDKHENIDALYNQLGYTYQEKGNLTMALSYYKETLEIQQSCLPSDHPKLLTTYNNIGEIFRLMGEYSMALSNFEKALEIQRKSLTPDHPELAVIYNNIGLTHYAMGEYSTARLYYEKTLEIRNNSVPCNHPDLATTYNNIGLTHYAMGEYATALSYYEKTLAIQRKSISPNHLSVYSTYNNIGLAHHKMKEYTMALSYYEKGLEIHQRSVPLNHPDLAFSYNNIGEVHRMIGDYSTALSYYGKALEIQKNSLSPDHPVLANTYTNIGSAYFEMNEHQTALSNYEKALNIRQKALPPYYPVLALTHRNIGYVHSSVGEYSTALLNYEKALEIELKSLPLNRSSLAVTYTYIGKMHQSMKQYSSALSYYEKALEIKQKALLPNHSSLAKTYNNIGSVQKAMEEYSSALLYYTQALEIEQSYRPPDHPTLEVSHYNIAKVLEKLCRYEEAIEHAIQAVDIACKGLGPEHSETKENQDYLDYLLQKLA